MIPDELHEQLRRVAAELDTSMASLIRKALEEKIKSHRPRPRSLGIGDSGRTDIARLTAEQEAIPEPWR